MVSRLLLGLFLILLGIYSFNIQAQIIDREKIKKEITFLEKNNIATKNDLRKINKMVIGSWQLIASSSWAKFNFEETKETIKINKNGSCLVIYEDSVVNALWQIKSINSPKGAYKRIVISKNSVDSLSMAKPVDTIQLEDSLIKSGNINNILDFDFIYGWSYNHSGMLFLNQNWLGISFEGFDSTAYFYKRISN